MGVDVGTAADLLIQVGWRIELAIEQHLAVCRLRPAPAVSTTRRPPVTLPPADRPRGRPP